MVRGRLLLADLDSSKSVQVDGAIVGTLVGGPDGLHSYDDLVAALRERAASIGLSFSTIDHLAGFADSATAKYLSDLRVKGLGLQTFFAITETLAIKAIFVEDERMLALMKKHWQRRNEGMARRANNSAKRLGSVTVARVLPEIARELGRRGGVRRRELPAEVRRKLAVAAARARWAR
jgi:hypothetical protein